MTADAAKPMTRRVPFVPTLVVVAAVATMIALGVWQLQRRAGKEALIARYSQAQTLSAAVEWPLDAKEREAALFRHARLNCEQVLARGAVAGHSASGETGWAQTATCALVLKNGARGSAEVVLGWARDPAQVAWTGGEVLGFVAPGASDEPRLIASPPLAGLAASAHPDPRDMPNNHLAYAVQWFIFAAMAAVIYGLAVRKRLAGEEPPR